MAARGQFSSRLGFLMAAAGSAVGLGNIWGFPTQTASNGGAAFVLAYLLLAFLLAYPALMAELTIGRAKRANVVDALNAVNSHSTAKRAGRLVGFWGVITASLILSFYAILAGWMISHMFEPVTTSLGLSSVSTWLIDQSVSRNLIFTAVFYALTMAIIMGGVKNGIERWSTRLMPALFAILIALIAYVLTMPGAMEGLKLYLVPNFEHFSSDLILSAMGQAFFSLSLGVGTMLIYGSYVSDEENLPKLGVSLTLIDTGIAFTAGLLILPAMFVAQHVGTEIYNSDGVLTAGPGLIFSVLPTVFDSMGGIVGPIVAIAFFALMSIAALTSSISMLEVPVSYITERHNVERKKATWLTGTVVFLFSVLIICNFDSMFGFVADLATVYFEPLIALLFCVFAGWLWNRNELITEISKGVDSPDKSLFIKIWPWYVKFVCPVLILTLFVNSML